MIRPIIANLAFDDAEISDVCRATLALTRFSNSDSCLFDFVEVGVTKQFRWQFERHRRNSPDKTIQDVIQPNVLIVPGGFGVQAQLGNNQLMEWLKALVPCCEIVSGICDGSLLLAKAGLLDGIEVTIYPPRIAQLRQLAPLAVLRECDLWVECGKFLTSQNELGATEVSCKILGRYYGEEIVRQRRNLLEQPLG